jgi:hypothetical protein
MAVDVAVTRVACNTALGTQDITIASFGTPKAAMFILSYSITDGTAAADAALSIGAATGTANEWCYHWNSEDGQGTTDVHAEIVSTRCVLINTPGTSTSDGEAEFSAWITDGVRINWTTAAGSAWLLTVVLFGGADLSAHANNVGLGNTVDLETNITAPGFEPRLVIAVANSPTAIDIATSNVRPTYGVVHNDGFGAITQRSAAYRHLNGAATSEIDGHCTETYGLLAIGSNATVIWGGEFTNFDASGFSVITRVGAGLNTAMCYLALDFNLAAEGWVGTVDTPTGTGNEAVSGVPNTPQFVFQIGTYMEAIDTAYNNSALAGTVGFSTFDVDDEYMTSAQDEDGAGTTNAQSVSDNTAVELPDDDGAAGLTAAFVSMDSNGWTLNYSAVEANAKKFFGLAITGQQSDVLPQHRRHQIIGPY